MKNYTKEDFDFIALEEVHSTNTYSKEWIKTHKLTRPLVVSAHKQLAGRGQKGATWSADAGKNLTFSLVLPLKVPVTDQFKLNQAIVLGIINYLCSLGISAKVKWPNDIFVNGRKLAGVLIENMIRGKWIDVSIIGIGLNINQREFLIPNARPISTFQILKRELHLGDTLVGCSKYVASYVLSTGDTDLYAVYLQHLFQLNNQQEFRRTNGDTFIGIIVGVDKTGRLLVKLPNGTLEQFAFKEIEYIFTPA